MENSAVLMVRAEHASMLQSEGIGAQKDLAVITGTPLSTYHFISTLTLPLLQNLTKRPEPADSMEAFTSKWLTGRS